MGFFRSFDLMDKKSLCILHMITHGNDRKIYGENQEWWENIVLGTFFIFKPNLHLQPTKFKSHLVSVLPIMSHIPIMTTWAFTLRKQSGRMHFRLPLEVVESGKAQDPIYTCIYCHPLVILSTKTHLNTRCKQSLNWFISLNYLFSFLCTLNCLKQFLTRRKFKNIRSSGRGHSQLKANLQTHPIVCQRWRSLLGLVEHLCMLPVNDSTGRL